MTEALNKTEGCLHYVANLDQVKINFGDLTTGMDTAYCDPNSPYVHPRLKIYTVSTDMLVEIGTKTSNEQEQYKQVQAQLYPSLDDALNAIAAAK